MAIPTPGYSPRCEIIVCEGVGFDQTNQNFRLWDTQAEQLAYFNSKRIYRTAIAKPVKASDGELYVDNPADFYYNADYVLFQNTDFDSNRWFFAFITKVEYINLQTTKIYFKIDVMQTYFRDAIFTQCFIERAHSLTDEPGDNLLADNLELGEYVVNDSKFTNLFNEYSIVVACTVNESGAPSSGGYYAGIYSGLNLLQFSTASAVTDFLVEMIDGGKESSIVSVFMMPKAFYKTKDTSGTSDPVVLQYTYDAPKKDTVDGYTPTNKKLLTYPYKLLSASNLSGGSAEYRYENFAIGQVFNIIGDCSPNPTIKMAPLGYNGHSDSTNAFDYGLSINGFPQCAWVTDAYRAWLAQSGSVSALGMTFTGQDIAFAQQGIGAAGNLLSGNIGGAISSFLGIAQTMAQVNATKALPPQASGQTANGAMVAFKAKDFVFTDLSVKSGIAQSIDTYWTKYGYPDRRVRLPNFKVRPNFNFIKTQGCNTKGNIPQWARTEIQTIFDSGVTIWHTDDIGNYALPNAPI